MISFPIFYTEFFNLYVDSVNKYDNIPFLPFSVDMSLGAHSENLTIWATLQSTAAFAVDPISFTLMEKLAKTIKLARVPKCMWEN